MNELKMEFYELISLVFTFQDNLVIKYVSHFRQRNYLQTSAAIYSFFQSERWQSHGKGLKDENLRGKKRKIHFLPFSYVSKEKKSAFLREWEKQRELYKGMLLACKAGLFLLIRPHEEKSLGSWWRRGKQKKGPRSPSSASLPSFRQFDIILNSRHLHF